MRSCSCPQSPRRTAATSTAASPALVTPPPARCPSRTRVRAPNLRAVNVYICTHHGHGGSATLARRAHAKVALVANAEPAGKVVRPAQPAHELCPADRRALLPPDAVPANTAPTQIVPVVPLRARARRHQRARHVRNAEGCSHEECRCSGWRLLVQRHAVRDEHSHGSHVSDHGSERKHGLPAVVQHGRVAAVSQQHLQ